MVQVSWGTPGRGLTGEPRRDVQGQETRPPSTGKEADVKRDGGEHNCMDFNSSPIREAGGSPFSPALTLQSLS